MQNIKISIAAMIGRLKNWLFQKGKGCRRCCLRCKYYDQCRAEILSEVEQLRKNEAFINGIELAIDWKLYIPPADYQRYLELKESEATT